MSLNIQRKGRKLSRAITQLENATNSYVEVGHFRSQGEHGPSGLSYVELLKMWADGVEDSDTGQLVIQDVRAQFLFSYFRSKKIAKDPEIDLVISKFLSNLTSPKAADILLEGLGQVLRRRYKEFFNNYQGPHMKGTRTPLYETGELKGTVAYRTSKDSTVKE